MSTVYLASGVKGGVGKSMMALALVDYLAFELEKPVLLVDTDTGNPDTWRCYKKIDDKRVLAKLIDLAHSNGAAEVIDAAEGHSDRVVVINGSARDQEPTKRYVDTLRHVSDIGLVTFWLINEQADSLRYLEWFFRESEQPGLVHVVKNAKLAGEMQYARYNQSTLRKDVEAAGGRTITLPVLANRVADLMFSKEQPVHVLASGGQVGNRAEMCRWRHEVRIILGGVIDE